MSGRRGHALLGAAIAMVLVFSSFTAFAAVSETEYPLPRNQILYSELKAQLDALEAKNPDLMDYEVIGQSAGGKDLYLITISGKQGMQNLAGYQKFMQDAVKNPEKARKALKGGDIRIPVFLNASVHGNETTGTDAVLKLIDRLLTDNSAETKYILKNCVVLINVCQNPDGRISGYRENATGTDLNRDFITQSQPEVQAVVSNIAVKWFPTAMLDLHGFMNGDNILLEPCTGPHNPNYEYDLLIKYALPHAEAMSADITVMTKQKVDIPFKVWEDGWDDYPPIFAPQYFMYLGAISHTLEVKFPNQQGIDTAYAACYSSLQYAAKHKTELMDNQFAIFERGVKGINTEKDIDFPEAYIIPMNESQQQNLFEAAAMIRHLLANKIIVKEADAAFTADGSEYPAGTYVVPMKQGLRGLANTMLWKGEDISGQASAMYDISAYSFPELCGFDAVAVTKSFSAALSDVTEAPVLKGTLEAGNPANYIMPVENNQAYKVANSLVRDGFAVYRTSVANGDYAPGSFVIPNRKNVTGRLTGLAAENDVHIKGIASVNGKLLPVHLQKVVVIGNDGGVATEIKALGFDVTAIPYYAVNGGYDLEKNGFDALVISGTQGFWDESYEATGVTWSLDANGQQEVVDFAKNHDFIGAGYAGAKLNELAGKLKTSYSFTGNDDTGQTAENGICVINGVPADPISYGYGDGETVYAYAPIWFGSGSAGTGPAGTGSTEAVTSANFAAKDMYLAGFWKDPGAAAGAPVVIHDNSSSYDAVLFGIEPAFRSYMPATFGFMANALYYLGYDE